MKTRSFIVIVLILVAAYFGVDTTDLTEEKPFYTSKDEYSNQVLPSSWEEVTVTRVIDGDTIEIDTGQKVRYIGVDTPETIHPKKSVECFGKEATSFNKKLVEGKKVRLEKDVSNTDRYGRLLRYVYVGGSQDRQGGEIFVNKHLVSQGYARVSSYPPDIKYQQNFIDAERVARENLLGLWGNCDLP